MGKFEDLLKQPLPSKVSKTYTEEEEILESMEEELLNDNFMFEGLDNNESDKTEDSEYSDDETEITSEDDDIETIDEFDFSDVDDDAFADLMDDLKDGNLDDLEDSEEVEDDEEVTLSPNEEMKADDMMSIAATSMLVNDELNDEEKTDFIESQADIAINEGLMTESDVRELSYNLGLVNESKYNKKMLIRLDAESKKKQLFALAVNISAAAHNDADYRKYKKVMKMKKILRHRMTKKYKSEATKRMRVYFARLRRSKSSTLNKIGNKHN